MVSHKMAEVLSALPTLWFGVFYAFVELVYQQVSVDHAFVYHFKRLD